MPSRMKSIRTLVEAHLSTAYSGITISNEPESIEVIPKDQLPYAIVLVSEEEPERLDFKQERRRVVGEIKIAVIATPGATAEATREAMDAKLEAVRDAIFGDPYLTASVDDVSCGKAETRSGPDDVVVYGELDFQTDEIF